MTLRLAFMLHSVLQGPQWDYSYLSYSPAELVALIGFYRRLGFEFVKASDFFAGDSRRVCLTFDDGFLDNWTLLHPLLAERGVPYTVFVCRDFVEPTSTVRPHGDRTPGYLSQGEIRRMHESGLADIQSHSVTHTWYPTAEAVVDVFSPAQKAKYPWLLWNAEPASKPQWLQADYSRLAGLPVFQNDRSLRARRFLFDDDKLAHFQRRVVADGLNAEQAELLRRREYGRLGRSETPAEQQARYEAEIAGNADFIDGLLGYRPSVMCWPGGAYNELSEAVAYRFHACTTLPRAYGRDERYMHRISPGNPYGRDRFPWKHPRLTWALYTLRHASRSAMGASA